MVVALGWVIASLLVGRWLWGVVLVSTEPGRRSAPMSQDDVLLAGVSAAALAVVAWLAIGVALESVALLPGQLGRGAARLCALLSPFVLRRAAGVLLGASLGAVIAPGPTMASTGSTADVVVAAPVAVSSLNAVSSPTAVSSSAPVSASASPGPAFAAPPDVPEAPRGAEPSVLPQASPPARPDPGFGPVAGDGFVPEPPLVRHQPDVSVVAPAARRAIEDPEAREVVVHRGDSLWSIAARHLGHHPSDAQIADEWPRWYAANSSVIGADPDLLLPGQVLTVPDGTRR